jgi:hypothetical protein
MLNKLILMLPYELQINILKYSDFETLNNPFFSHINFDEYIYNEKIHTWKWAIENGHLDVVKFLHKKKYRML